jgi:hypothetical protein
MFQRERKVGITLIIIIYNIYATVAWKSNKNSGVECLAKERQVEIQIHSEESTEYTWE